MFLFSFLHSRAKQQNQPQQPSLRAKISQTCIQHSFTFGLPRTDTCARCEELPLEIEVSSGEEKEKLINTRNEHQDVAQAGYDCKRKDKATAKQSWSGKRRILGAQNKPLSEDCVDMVTFDFEQNLPTPNLHHSDHSDVFYIRQLWVYNFGINDCVAKQGNMMMWGENVAKHGSSEVTSCLQTFFKEFRSGAR